MEMYSEIDIKMVEYHEEKIIDWHKEGWIDWNKKEYLEIWRNLDK